METPNPYRAPRAKVEADPRLPTLEATRKRRRLMAFAILGMSVVGSLFYVIMDEVLLQTAVGAWPMLFGTAIASIISSILTRHLLMAPMCCFAGTMSGDLLAGFVRSWRYAQVDICLPLALGFSIPAFLLTLLLLCFEPKPLRNDSEQPLEDDSRISDKAAIFNEP